MKSKKKQEEPTEYEFSDKVTRDKIEKHIHDITDTISDQDIKNVKVPGADTPSSPIEEDKNVMEGKPVKTKKVKKEKDEHITPWDILDE